MNIENVLDNCESFDWDDANSDKNWDSHRVSDLECEEIFFNSPLVVRGDIGHSNDEKRFYALGQTDACRPLFIAFAIRGSLIRVISARDMNRNERGTYEHATEEKEDTDL